MEVGDEPDDAWTLFLVMFFDYVLAADMPVHMYVRM